MATGSEEEADIERPEVLEAYMLRHVGIGSKDGGPLVLDPIAAETIGRMNLRLWCTKVEAITWMKAVANMLGKGEYTERASQKDPPAVHTSARVLSLLGDVPLLRKRGRRESPQAACGLFLVPKKNGLSRLVFDARPANCLLRKLDGMRLFTVEELVQVFGEMCRGGPVHACTSDFKHFFYQIPLHRNLQTLFGVGKQHFPTVLPMGFHSAPEAAQSISWSVLLHREKDEQDLGVGKLECMPKFVKVMRDGSLQGALFVILDNILILGTSADFVQRWQDRMFRNIQLFNLEVKKEEFFLGPLQGEARCSFSGVEFSEIGWRPVVREETQMHTDTLRTALGTAGALLWEIRVRGMRFGRYKGLRSIYRRVAAEYNTKAGWDAPFEATAEEKADVETLEAIRNARQWCKWEIAAPKTVIYAATDATPRSQAYVILHQHSRLGCTIRARTLDQGEIAERELGAILWLATDVSELREKGAKGIVEIRVATDNAVCHAIVEKGYSKSERLDVLLDQLEDLRDAEIRVRTSWICSEDNVADDPSRQVLEGVPLGLSELRFQSTLDVLRRP